MSKISIQNTSEVNASWADAKLTNAGCEVTFVHGFSAAPTTIRDSKIAIHKCRPLHTYVDVRYHSRSTSATVVHALHRLTSKCQK